MGGNQEGGKRQDCSEEGRINTFGMILSSAEIKTIEDLLLEPQETAVVDVRTTWPAPYRCDDGHYVRSKSETLIDNWLYHHRLAHAYEKKVPGEGKLPDFYIPVANCYLEHWGRDDAKYLANRDEKRRIYLERGIRLVQLTEKDVENLDDALLEKLTPLLPKGMLD